jgi:hypothetical protein
MRTSTPPRIRVTIYWTKTQSHARSDISMNIRKLLLLLSYKIPHGLNDALSIRSLQLCFHFLEDPDTDGDEMRSNGIVAALCFSAYQSAPKEENCIGATGYSRTESPLHSDDDLVHRTQNITSTRHATVNEIVASRTEVTSMGRDDDSFRDPISRFNDSGTRPCYSASGQYCARWQPGQCRSFFNWARDLRYLRLLCSICKSPLDEDEQEAAPLEHSQEDRSFKHQEIPDLGRHVRGLMHTWPRNMSHTVELGPIYLMSSVSFMSGLYTN